MKPDLVPSFLASFFLLPNNFSHPIPCFKQAAAAANKLFSSPVPFPPPLKWLLRLSRLLLRWLDFHEASLCYVCTFFFPMRSKSLCLSISLVNGGTLFWPVPPSLFSSKLPINSFSMFWTKYIFSCIDNLLFARFCFFRFHDFLEGVLTTLKKRICFRRLQKYFFPKWYKFFWVAVYGC